MIPNSLLNAFENLFDDCVWECRMLDRSSIELLGGVFNGDASIIKDWTGKQAKVLDLDGTGDYIDYGNNGLLNVLTGDFSVDFVIKTTDEAGVIFGKLNTDENMEIPRRFGIMAIPTLLFFKNGELVERITGVVPKENIEGVVKKYL